MKIINCWSQAPFNSMQLNNPNFRHMTPDEICKFVNMEENWKPFGYKLLIILKDSSTVFITR